MKKLKEILNNIKKIENFQLNEKIFIESLDLFLNQNEKSESLFMKENDKSFVEKYHKRLFDSNYHDLFSNPDFNFPDELFTTLITFYECKRPNYKG